MDIKIIYEDNDVLVVDKPAGIVTFPEGQTKEGTLIDLLLEKYPELADVGEQPRYGVVHRLDKDTSGILLVAKSTEALIFLQKQFKNRGVEKKYIALATGHFTEDSGTIETLMSRSPHDPRRHRHFTRGQAAPLSARYALTEWHVIQRFERFTLLEMNMKTGRKHQLRAHCAFIHHPIVGDTLYQFKDSPQIKGLQRQFLHATHLRAQMPSGEIKEFSSPLPEDLQQILQTLS